MKNIRRGADHSIPRLVRYIIRLPPLSIVPRMLAWLCGPIYKGQQLPLPN